MEITDGALSYTFLFDVSQGEESMERLIENLKAMGLSAEEAGKVADELAETMTKTLTEIAETSQDAAEALDKIRDKSDEFRDSAENLDDSIESVKADFLADSLDEVGNAVEEDAAAFEELTGDLDETSRSANISSIAVKALSVVTGKATASTKALSVAQTALNKSLKANPYAAITLAVFGGIAALTKWLMYDRETEKQAKKTTLALSGEVAIFERLSQLMSANLDNLGEGYAKLDENFKETSNLDAYRKGIIDLQNKETQALDDMIKSDDVLKNNFITNARKVEEAVVKQRENIENEKKKIEEFEAEGRNYLTGEYRRLKEINEANEKINKSEAMLERLIPFYRKSEELRKKHNEKLAELATEEFNIKQREVNDERAMQNAKINQMKEGYAKQVEVIKSARAAEREALQAKIDNPNSGLTVAEKERIKDQIEESKKVEAREIADIYLAQNEAIKKAEESLAKAEYEITQKRIEMQRKQRQVEIDLMKEGSNKQIAQMRLDHEKRLDEIEREANEEAEAMREANKQKWLDEQRQKGRSVTEADWYASGAFKSLNNGLTDEQWKQVKDQRERDVENENAIAAKKNKDFLEQMLADYKSYTAKKKDLDNKYLSELGAAIVSMMTATTTEERNMYANMTKDIAKANARANLELELDTIDTTAYDNIEEKMSEINKAYDEYIKKLEAAGATEAEINAAKQEQVANAGRLAMLEAQRTDLETKISQAISENKDNTEEYENWVKLLKEVQDEIDKIERKTEAATNQADSFATAWEKAAEKIKNTDIFGQLEIVGSFMDKWADVEGTKGFSYIGQVISAIGSLDFQKLFDTILNIFTDDYFDNIEKAYALKEAQLQVELDLTKAHYDEMNAAGETIFGKDRIAALKNQVSLLEEISQKTKDAYAINYGYDPDELRRLMQENPKWSDMIGQKPEEILSRGIADIAIKTEHNFLSLGDTFETFGDIAEKVGMDVYDQYGNINTKFAEYVLETYDTLTAEQKAFLKSAIQDSEAYTEAMEGVASYLDDLFGNVADTIADQMLDAFIKSGDAAIDFGAVVSDVGKQMAKDLLKSMIMDTYFNGLKEKFTEKIKDEGGMTADAAGYIMQMMNQAVDNLNGDIAYWNQVITNLSTLWGDAEAASIGAGNALTSSSQESIDLMNGQLNAMRAYQGRMESMMNAVLLQLSGIHNDMNAHFEESNRHLNAIDSNTSKEGLVRSLGAYFG